MKVLNLLILVMLFASFSLYADEQPQVSPVTNAGIQLDCDTHVDGSVCPVRNASRAGLLDDTTVRVSPTSLPSTTDGAE
jgi:hypothetical protein